MTLATQAGADTHSSASEPIWLVLILAFLVLTPILGPLIFIGYAMNSKRKKIRVYGYYCISVYFTFLGFTSFKMAYDEVNTAGYVAIPLFAYGTFWAWKRAKQTKNGLDAKGFPIHFE